jgi:transposase-like protein
VTAGTIFDKTRTPLTVWFEAAWLMTAAKPGISALTLSRLLPVASYQTTWTMLHKYRHAMGAGEKTLLSGDVEVDEWMYGGVRHNVAGRGSKKQLVLGAVEQLEKGLGRVRFGLVDNASGKAIQTFLTATIAPGSTILTDGWQSYRKATGGNYGHVATVERTSDDPAHVLLPGVHRVFSLADRWILGTHQGAVRREHLQSYLDEFAFRFNRRKAKHRGLLFMRLLEHAVNTPPKTYRDLVMTETPGSGVSLGPGGTTVPGTLEGSKRAKPWRK